LSACAIVAAALLVVGGAYFVGYVGELQRTLSSPAAAQPEATQHVAAIEQALGHAGFLKSYRNYRVTGDSAARPLLTQHTIDAQRALGRLKRIYAGDPAAAAALREAENVGEAFAYVAQTAPDPGTAPLRGSAAMGELSNLPQPPQLEASYLALRTALDRLTSADRSIQIGGLAVVLNWSQWFIIAAIGALVIGLLVAAGALQLSVVQPLKSLERSLNAVGDGAVTEEVWGTERADEFGALARAGDRLRRGLTETTALQALANKGQLHLTLDGQSSQLLQRLADDVTQTTTALKAAAADFAHLQDGNRRQLDAALANLQASTAGASQAAEALRDNATVAATANEQLGGAIADRVQRLDRLTEKFDHSRRQVAQMAAEIGGRARTATDEIAASAATLKTAAEGVGQIQSTLSSALTGLSSGAGKATDKVHTLAARLSETIGLVDERLSRKLAALDALEQAVTANLAGLRTKAEEASLAMNATMGEMDQRVTAAIGTHSSDLAAAIARLDEIAGNLANPRGRSADTGAGLQALADALQGQLETVRGEIRDLAIRMTEERLLATSDARPAFSLAGDAADFTAAPHRTLADVPGEEIMARLKDLAAEMNAAHEHADQTASLKAALGKFADEVKELAAGADRVARLQAMGRALDRYAEEIEAHAPEVGPSTALRTELGAITGELRSIAARAQASGTKNGAEVRDAALEVGARAASLFAYLAETHPGDDDAAESFAPSPDAAGDIAALGQLIDRIEARATSLAVPQPGNDTNGAIHMVFESIGRLNNIATALARAGRAERSRHATH
jgi:methyl-accepting chemotaxis protein